MHVRECAHAHMCMRTCVSISAHRVCAWDVYVCMGCVYIYVCVCWLVGCLLACLLACLLGWLVGWLVGRVVGWLVGWTVMAKLLGKGHVE